MEESTETPPANPGAKSAFSPEYDRSQLPDLLQFYYSWIFPYQKYYEWLSYGMSRPPLIIPVLLMCIGYEMFPVHY